MKPMQYFFLVACIFSWAVWIPLALSRIGLIPVQLPMPLYFLGAFGPMIGAVICSKQYNISSPKQLFKQLFASFMGQAVNYTDFSSTYFGNTTATDISTIVSTYPLPSDLSEIKSFSTTSKQSSISLYPGQVYRFSGSTSGITSGDDGVAVESVDHVS